MLERLNAQDLKVVAVKSKNFAGYEVRIKNAKTGADLYAKELPEGAFKLLSSKHWAYKHGQKYWFNTTATAKDIKYFTSGEFLEELTGAKKIAPKATPKAQSKSKKPVAKKSSKEDILAQMGELFSEEQLRALLAIATK